MTNAERQEALLLSAFKSFADKGYKGATVRDIVGRVGLSVNMISVYFGSKEGIANALIEKLKETLVTPVAHAAESIGSDYAWRIAVKTFVKHFIDLCHDTTYPNCYFAALYRHESANLHAKKVTLHDAIILPVQHEFEKLIALGVESRDPVQTRLYTLLLWNNTIAYALKHPQVIEDDVPQGFDPRLFRDMTIEFMVEKCIRDLHFVPQPVEGASKKSE